jgi:hypothetical protein
MSTLSKESDRGLVLGAIAIIDDSLTIKLEQVLSAGSKAARRRLLAAPFGALSGFMSKVDLAFCLGLYSRALYEDIRLLNRLRNRCAHEWRSFKIDAEIVQQYLRPMHVWGTVTALVEFFKKGEPPHIAPLPPQLDIPRFAFGNAAAILISLAEASVPKAATGEPAQAEDEDRAATGDSGAT